MIFLFAPLNDIFIVLHCPFHFSCYLKRRLCFALAKFKTNNGYGCCNQAICISCYKESLTHLFCTFCIYLYIEKTSF